MNKHNRSPIARLGNRTKQLLAILTVSSTAMWLPQTAAFAQAPAADPAKPASPWQFTVGLGAGLSPDYEGSDDYSPMALPIIDITWNDTVSIGTMGGPGIKVKALKIKGPSPRDHFTITTSLGYYGGRDQDDNDALNGLGDLDGGVTGGVSAKYQIRSFGASLSVTHDLDGDREGTSVNGGISYTPPLGFEKTFVTLATSTTWANDEYMSNTFGITSAQAATSQRNLRAYTAESGIKDFDVSASVMHRFTKNIGAFGQAKFTQLMGDAEDSPLVAIEGDTNQMSLFVGVTYTW